MITYRNGSRLSVNLYPSYYEEMLAQGEKDFISDCLIWGLAGSRSSFFNSAIRSDLDYEKLKERWVSTFTIQQ